MRIFISQCAASHTSCAHTHTLSLSHTHAHSHTYTHTHMHTHTHTHTQDPLPGQQRIGPSLSFLTDYLSLSTPLSLTHTHSFTQINSVNTVIKIHNVFLAFSLCLFLSHTHIHTQTYTRTGSVDTVVVPVAQSLCRPFSCLSLCVCVSLSRTLTHTHRERREHQKVAQRQHLPTTTPSNTSNMVYVS